MNEYRDGILLFDLTDQRIWSQSMSDSLGLYTHFEANKEALSLGYTTSIHYLRLRLKEDCQESAKRSEESFKDSLLLVRYNEKSVLNLQIETKTEENAAATVTSLNVFETSPITEVNGRYQFIQVTEVLPAGYKKLEEVKGLVAADYQKLLEIEWVEGLRSAYPVMIDQKVRDEVIQELSR